MAKRPGKKTICYSSITSNYLPKARVLAKSIKQHNPDVLFYLVLCDAVPKGFRLKEEPFDNIILIEDIDIPDRERWIFKHTVVELCTAVKGPALVYLLEKEQADRVLYFDPDIVILSPLARLFEALDSTSVLLTPHQCTPDTELDYIIDNEICSLKHGIYNLGFIGVHNTEQGVKFAKWWRDRLRHFCYDDIPSGLFTDQRWVDIALAFFDDILIHRDPTCNVATWNLTQREVIETDGKLTVEGSPIQFFHFSGFDSGAQEIMLNKFAEDNNGLKKLRKWYIEAMDSHGQEALGDIPCVYEFFSNGERITLDHRKLYRHRKDLETIFPNPSKAERVTMNYCDWFEVTYAHNIKMEKAAASEFKELFQLLESTMDQKHEMEKALIETRAAAERDNTAMQKPIEELQGIYNSHGWKMLRKYYIFRDILLPSGSQRRRIMKSVFRLFTS